MIGIGIGLDAGRAPVAAEEPANLIDNGTFDDDSVWALGGNAEISGGKLTTPAGSGTAAQDTNAAITEGLFYELALTIISAGSPSVTPSLGGTAGTTMAGAGTFEQYLRAGSTQELLLDFSEATVGMEIDDASLTGPAETPLNTELVPDPGFDDAGAWTIAGSGAAEVSGGVLTASGGIGNRSATCSPDGYPLNAGTYDVTFTIVSRTAGSARVEVCGILGTNRNAAGTYNQQLVVAEADTVFQTIIVRMITSPNLVIDDVHVEKIA